MPTAVMLRPISRARIANTVTSICGPSVTAQNGAVQADGWYAGGGLDFMVHKGALVDVLLGVEYQHFDVSGGEAFCRCPGLQCSAPGEP